MVRNAFQAIAPLLVRVDRSLGSDLGAESVRISARDLDEI